MPKNMESRKKRTIRRSLIIIDDIIGQLYNELNEQESETEDWKENLWDQEKGESAEKEK